MKIRVMAHDGTIIDFDTEAEALPLFNLKKKLVEKTKVTTKVKPSCNIHRCYHDENPPRPCEIIEKYEK